MNRIPDANLMNDTYLMNHYIREIKFLLRVLKFAELWYDEYWDDVELCLNSFTSARYWAIRLSKDGERDPAAETLIEIERELEERYGDSPGCVSQMKLLFWRSIAEKIYRTLTLMGAQAIREKAVWKLLEVLASMRSEVRKAIVRHLEEVDDLKLIPPAALKILKTDQIRVTVAVRPVTALRLLKRYGTKWKKKLESIIAELAV